MSLKQTVIVTKKYSTCERGVWVKHEKDHVKDNQKIAKDMEKQIKADPKLKAMYYAPQWQIYSYSLYQKVQRDSRKIIGGIFKKLVAEAIKKRDTTSEYARFQRLKIKTCPGPFYHTVKSKDTLPSLAWYYYGNNNAWKPIYEANKKTIGSTPKISPGQVLKIPKPPKT